MNIDVIAQKIEQEKPGSETKKEYNERQNQNLINTHKVRIEKAQELRSQLTEELRDAAKNINITLAGQLAPEKFVKHFEYLIEILVRGYLLMDIDRFQEVESVMDSINSKLSEEHSSLERFETAIYDLKESISNEIQKKRNRGKEITEMEKKGEEILEWYKEQAKDILSIKTISEQKTMQINLDFQNKPI